MKFNFADAVEQAKRGYLVARNSWGPDYGVIFFRPDDRLDSNIIPNIKSIPQSLKDYIANDTNVGESILFTGYLSRYEKGTVMNAWIPTEEDKKATDWVIV